VICEEKVNLGHKSVPVCKYVLSCVCVVVVSDEGFAPERWHLTRKICHLKLMGDGVLYFQKLILWLSVCVCVHYDNSDGGNISWWVCSQYPGGTSNLRVKSSGRVEHTHTHTSSFCLSFYTSVFLFYPFLFLFFFSFEILIFFSSLFLSLLLYALHSFYLRCGLLQEPKQPFSSFQMTEALRDALPPRHSLY